MQVFPDDRVRRRCRCGDPAGELRRRNARGQSRERFRHRVARILRQAVPVNRGAIQSGWRPGFQATHGQIQALQGAGQTDRGCFADPAGLSAPFADMDDATQESAGRQHGRRASHSCPVRADYGGEAAAVSNLQILDRRGAQRESRGGVKSRAHGAAIQPAVGLGARATHRRPFASVQQLEMNAGRVRHLAHQAVKGIDLANQMSLADPADRRVARHLAQCCKVVCQQQRSRAHAGGGRGSLTPGMAAADHDDVKGRRDVLAHRRCHVSGWRAESIVSALSGADQPLRISCVSSSGMLSMG